MKLRTTLPPGEFPFSINYQSRILSLGSCFATHIGQRLAAHLFPILSNPFGIVYHPLAMAQSLDRLLDGRKYEAAELIFQNDLYHSLDHHGDFSGPAIPTVLENINASLLEAGEQLRRANFLFLTLGTSWGYYHLEKKTWAANCHKIPQPAFSKKITKVEEMLPTWQKIIARMLEINPELKIIFTVSPVRHVKDGLLNNSLSKAHLRLLIDSLQEIYPAVFYFPAFELMVDDLRDYRFYQSDLLHPSVMAQEYIWKYFQQAFFDEITGAQYSSIANLVQAAQHRPFHPALPAHQQFLKTQLEKIEKLSAKNPTINFAVLKDKFQGQLVKSSD